MIAAQDGINEDEREPLATHIATFDPPTVLALIDQIERLQGENSTLADLAKARHEWNKKNRTELKDRLEQAEQAVERKQQALGTLARIIETQQDGVILATDSQDLIGEDGVGDWDAVWDRVAELGEGKSKAEQAVQRVRQVVANLEDHSRPRTAHKFAVAENLRRALDGDTRG
ncbi:hypothetical protein D3C74_381550 [compost metagenome]